MLFIKNWVWKRLGELDQRTAIKKNVQSCEQFYELLTWTMAKIKKKKKGKKSRYI